MLPLDLADCAQALAERGRASRVLEITGSTNDDARSWASEGAAAGSVVVADAQQAGRGRQGRAWSTQPGGTLAMSVVLRPRLAPTDLPPLSLVVGLAVRAAIAKRLASPVKVKWPNDVLVSAAPERRAWDGERKIAGILVEAALSGRAVEHVIVGIGINVAREHFPAELEGRATSLALAGAKRDGLHRGALLLDVLDALDFELEMHFASRDGIAERIAPHDALRGRRVRLASGGLGVADGLERDGRLRVRLDDGSVIHAVAGEVSLLP